MTSTWEIRAGDCIEVMGKIPTGSIEAVVTDPPYGLGFMGKDWDSPGGTGDFPMRRTTGANTVNTGVSRQGGRQRSTVDFAKRQARDAASFAEWTEAWASEALRVLKPGGHLLAFGGARTFHRLTVGLEDAGFEIRDCLSWLYGSGFPKSLNLDGDWQGWGTALKPAWEPITLARKSTQGTVAANVAAHGTGALNIDGCRLAAGEGGDRDGEDSAGRRYAANGSTDLAATPGPRGGSADGRWPANVVLDEEAAAQLDDQTGILTSGSGPLIRHADKFGRSVYGDFKGTDEILPPGDSGGASRFLYVAKASPEERNRGLDGFAESKPHDVAGHKHTDGRAWDIPGSLSTARANSHPTVKPVELMRWLVRLVTPPGGMVLDPFTGSGTTGIAALREGFSFLGIEREAEYVEIARARILGDAPLLNFGAEVAA